MKTLLFLRHAKSDWDADYSGDHARPLARRGRKAAKRMGRFLAAAGEVPDFALSSTAVRARDTLRRVLRAGGWEGLPFSLDPALYLEGPAVVLRRIQAAPDAATRLLVVGHEPDWSDTVSRLIGGGALRFPTACIARVDVPAASWREVDFGGGELVWMVPPKVLA